MFGFTYYAPTKVIFGRGAQTKAGEEVKAASGTRVLLHYGGKSAEKSGLIDQLKQSLQAAGLYVVTLGGVQPNPRLSKVREGIALAKENGIDFILAAGGGSVIDSSKAIAYGLAEPDKDVWELFAHTRKAAGCLPVGVVLTIAAAGSEMSNSCVITNWETQEKRSYNSDIARPKFTIMNPELTMTLPDYQTQSGCTDIMMHTMERYFTQGGNMEITDTIAEALVKTVMKNAKILRDDPANYDARAEVMWAGSLSHNGLTGCGTAGGDFASHKMEHEMGGLFDVTHGAGLAAIWPSWARYVVRDDLDRFVRFAEKVTDVARTPDMSEEDVALAGIGAIEDFFRSIGMPVNMRELGIEPTEEQIAEMADSCLRAAGGPIGAAKKLQREDLINIYKMAR